MAGLFELKTHFQIDSARFLPLLPKEHPCANMHGHTFKIILTLRGQINPQIGWVQDYHEINEVIKPLLGEIDHKVLNEVPGLENPTSEYLAMWIFDRTKAKLPLLKSVTVMETPTTECTYPVN